VFKIKKNVIVSTANQNAKHEHKNR